MIYNGQYSSGRFISSSLTRPNFPQHPTMIRNQFPNVSILCQNTVRYVAVNKPTFCHVNTNGDLKNYNDFKKGNLYCQNATGEVLFSNTYRRGTRSEINNLMRIRPDSNQLVGISPRVPLTIKCNNAHYLAPNLYSINEADHPFEKSTTFTSNNYPIKRPPELLDAGQQTTPPPPTLNENQLSPTTESASTSSSDDDENETNNSKMRKPRKSMRGCNVVSELIYFHFAKNDLPEPLRSVLPKISDYHVVKYRIHDEHSFDAKIRLKANTPISLKQWLTEFELLTDTIYHSQRVYKNTEQYAYSERFICQMNRIYRNKRVNKGKFLRTNCKAVIHVMLPSDNNHDMHRKIGMISEVDIHFVHNHSEVPVTAPIHVVKNEFFTYYGKMISPTKAKKRFCQNHKKEIKEYKLTAPRLQTIRCWYRKWNEQFNTTTAIIEKHKIQSKN
ncbi:hypothetical protein T06_1198 [Trichinella sp. T6]|nr:hypothetical protein T06_1198 [Trichinella sp. T6]